MGKKTQQSQLIERIRKLIGDEPEDKILCHALKAYLHELGDKLSTAERLELLQAKARALGISPKETDDKPLMDDMWE